MQAVTDEVWIELSIVTRGDGRLPQGGPGREQQHFRPWIAASLRSSQ